MLLHAENVLDTVGIMSDFIDDAKTSGYLARMAGPRSSARFRTF